MKTGIGSAPFAGPEQAPDSYSFVDSAPVTAGGTGYKVGDVVQILGGTFSKRASIRVATITGAGVVATVTIADAGWYSATPAGARPTAGYTRGSGFTTTTTYDTFP